MSLVHVDRTRDSPGGLTGGEANISAQPSPDPAKWRVLRPAGGSGVYPWVTMSTVEEILAAAPAKRARRRTIARQATRTLNPGRSAVATAVAAALALAAWGIIAAMVAAWFGAPAAWSRLADMLAV